MYNIILNIVLGLFATFNMYLFFKLYDFVYLLIYRLNDSDSDDWSDQVELEYPPALSSHTNDSSLRIPNHGHTPSQSSCCSNDTLFNFDDIASTNEKENNTDVEYQPETNLQDDVFERVENDIINAERSDFTDDSDDKTVKNSDRAESETYSSNEHFREETDHTMDDIGCNSNSDGVTEPVLLERIIPTSPEDPSTGHICIDDFLSSERNHTSSACSSLSFSIKVVSTFIIIYLDQRSAVLKLYCEYIHKASKVHLK